MPLLLRPSKNPVWTVLLVAVLLTGLSGVIFHVATAHHDPQLCQVCTWFSSHGWTLVLFLWLFYCTSERFTLPPLFWHLSSPFSFFSSRSPPIR